MKKILIILIIILIATVTLKSQSACKLIDKGSYVDVAIASGDTMSLMKNMFMYPRVIGNTVYAVFAGYGGNEIQIKVDTAGLNCANLAAARVKIAKMFASENVMDNVEKYFLNTITTADTVSYTTSDNLLKVTIAPLASNTDTVFVSGETVTKGGLVSNSYKMTVDDPPVSLGNGWAIINSITIRTKSGGGCFIAGTYK